MKNSIWIAAAMGIANALAAESALAPLPASADCTVVDMWSQLDDDAKSMQEMSFRLFGEAHDPSWLKNVRICKAGRYTVWTPADGKSDHILFFSDDGLAMTLDGGSVIIFEKNKKPIASLEDKDHNGTIDFVEYFLKPTPPSGDIDVWDRDADGCPDMKFFDGPDGAHHRVFNLAGRWAEFEKRGNKWGYMIDGEFYPSPKARSIAIEKSLDECAHQRERSTSEVH